MLGPSISMVSAPFAVGYARATLRGGSRRGLAATALVIAIAETAALVFLLLQATLPRLHL